MNTNSTHTCDSMNELISGYIDNELTQQQSQRVSLHLEGCDCCTKLYRDLLDIKTRTGKIDMPQLEEEKIIALLEEPTSNALANIGWIALVIGGLGLMLWHWVTFWQDDSVPTLVKVLLTLVEAGVMLLFISVLRQRLISRKTDRYKDVQL